MENQINGNPKLDKYLEKASESAGRYENSVRLFRGDAVKLDEQKLETAANRRAAYALGEKIGLKPGEVDRIIAMARSEIGPKDMRALAKESGAEAAAKGKPYVEKALSYREG